MEGGECLRLHKRITAGVLCASFSSCFMLMPVAAAVANPYEWDGEGKLYSDRIYYINESISVNGSFDLPESSSMTVKSGASIVIPNGSALSVSGKLYIENGASLIIGGRLVTAENSSLAVEGVLAASALSYLETNGAVLFSDTSGVRLGGTADIAYLFSYGSIDISGDTTLNGGIINGGFAITADGDVINTGLLVLGGDCRYSLDGSFVNSEGGSVDDNRKLYSQEAILPENIALYTTDTPLEGIDVSWAQGDTIDWERVAASGIDFAVVRSSRGRLSDDYPMKADSQFHRNMVGAAQNGIPVGIYHYSYAETVDEARDEARFVLSLIEGYDVSYPIVFDIEDNWYIENGYTKETLTAMTAAFCDEIRDAGYMPMVYSYASFLNSYLDMDALSDYPVWVAHVNTDSPAYSRPYFIWQYSWEGSDDGIDGDVDLDYCYVDFVSYMARFGLNRQ